MKTLIACPSCDHALRIEIPDEPSTGDCPHCGGLFQVGPESGRADDTAGQVAAAIKEAMAQQAEDDRAASFSSNFYGGLFFALLGLMLQYFSAWLAPAFLGCYALAVVIGIILAARGAIAYGAAVILTTAILPLLLFWFRALDWLTN